MATEIRVPTLGESVSEATIGKWFKKAGDAVKADEPIVELETDKVTLEVPAPASGVLAEILAAAGTTVTVNALLGLIAEGAKAAAAAPAAKVEAPASVAAAPAAPATTSMPAAPAAAKLMADSGVSVEAGSGKRGQVLKGDVLAAIANPVPVAAPIAAPVATPVPAAPRVASSADDAPREERVKMTRLRQTIARRLKEAQNQAAMLTTFNEVDMGPVMDLRNKYKELFEKKHGTKLGFMGFFTKAVTHALKEIPAVNAEIDGQDIIYKNFCHIGVAVGTDKGLVVPVVRNADQMSISDIEKDIARLGKAARDGALSMADMQGGTTRFDVARARQGQRRQDRLAANSGRGGLKEIGRASCRERVLMPV